MEHVQDAETSKESSHIVKHWMTYHQEEESRTSVNFFKVLISFKDCFSRKVAETIRIHYAMDELLNIKNEYNANHLSRMVEDEMKRELFLWLKTKLFEEILCELENQKKHAHFTLALETNPLSN